MKDYENRILNQLVDQYERSKTFVGKNTVHQNFTVKIVTLFPAYADDAEYDLFQKVNEAVDTLLSRQFITAKKQGNGVVVSVTLCMDALDAVYDYLKRRPKQDILEGLKELLEEYRDRTQILTAYCTCQLSKLSDNKRVDFLDCDFTTAENILKVLANIETVTDETYQRDFSIRVLGDSKAFEKIRSKVESILFEYGDFPQKETILEDLNIIKNPGHVYFKGNGKLKVGEQIIDFSCMQGDLAVSSSLLKSISEIEVIGDSVITIENLTTFNAFSDRSAFAIYLGGYHNTDRRNFIMKVFEQNKEKQFLHYGDIDAGGLYILKHLRQKTGIEFQPYRMDIVTLQKYGDFVKPLTDNDRKRLKDIKDPEFQELINYMLKHNCKLEQEAMD